MHLDSEPNTKSVFKQRRTCSVRRDRRTVMRQAAETPPLWTSCPKFGSRDKQTLWNCADFSVSVCCVSVVNLLLLFLSVLVLFLIWKAWESWDFFKHEMCYLIYLPCLHTWHTTSLSDGGSGRSFSPAVSSHSFSLVYFSSSAVQLEIEASASVTCLHADFYPEGGCRGTSQDILSAPED